MTAQQIKEKFAVEYQEALHGLQNFDIPSQRTINWFFHKIGEKRFEKVSGKRGFWYDKFDQMSGHSQEIPSKLKERWESY